MLSYTPTRWTFWHFTPSYTRQSSFMLSYTVNLLKLYTVLYSQTRSILSHTPTHTVDETIFLCKLHSVPKMLAWFESNSHQQTALRALKRRLFIQSSSTNCTAHSTKDPLKDAPIMSMMLPCFTSNSHPETALEIAPTIVKPFNWCLWRHQSILISERSLSANEILNLSARVYP